MTDSTQHSTQSPGKILATAREEAGLSVIQAADQLHLRPAVIEALEQENYADFSSAVFVKGYFRSYCRLVGLHEERMLDLLEPQLAQHFGNLEQAKSVAEQSASKIKKSRAIKRLSLYAVILLALVFIGLSYVQQESSDGIEQNNVAVPQTDKPESARSEALGEEVPPTMEPTDSSEDNPGDRALPEESEPEQIEQPVSPVADEQSLAQLEAEQAGSATQEPEVASDAVVKDDESKSLEIEFSGDCWLKVTDGQGKVVAAALKTQGQVFSYRGITPFELVLGDARVAELTFEGELYDLARHTSRNGRAAFQLN